MSELRNPCPYCGEVRLRSECIEEGHKRHVLPACAVGQRNDEPHSLEYLAWIAEQKRAESRSRAQGERG